MILIREQSTLNKICLNLFQQEVIAIDTEFIRISSYYPILSLVQIYDGINTFIIDAMLDLDYTPLSNLLRDPKILKICHSGYQDVEALHFNLNVNMRNVFDTQISYKFIESNIDISYADLVQKYIGVKILKDQQFSDWNQRPLSKQQLEYAARDVRYLIEIYDQMKETNQGLKIWDWIIEESNNMAANSDFCTPIIKLLRKFIKMFSDEQLVICLRILKWREKISITKNLTRSRVMHDNKIIHIIKKSNFNNIPQSISLDTDNITLDEKNIIANAKQSSRILHKNPEFSKLKQELESTANKYNIDPTLIANAKELLSYAHGSRNVRFKKGWRYEVFGQYV